MAKQLHTTIANWLIKEGYEKIEPMEYMRFMFPQGELATFSENPKSSESNAEWKYNAILLENTHKKKSVRKTDPLTGKSIYSEKDIWKSYMVFDDLFRIQQTIDKFGQTESDFFLSPISYLGRRRIKKNERWIYAVIIEVNHPKVTNVDGHRVQQGMKQLVWDWTGSSIPYLMPSAIVSSGTGVHLVWFLDRPYQLQTETQKRQWDNFRTRFTFRIWNQYVTKEAIQYENHCQSFRIPGTRTKNDQLVEAFWLSKKRYTLTELFRQVDLDKYPVIPSEEEAKRHPAKFEKMLNLIDNGVFEPDDEMLTPKLQMPKGQPIMTDRMKECAELYPEWYEERIIQHRPKVPRAFPGQWKCNRGLYDWFLEASKKGAFVGSRYHRVHALAQFARKCNIPWDEFKTDAEGLYDVLKTVGETEPFYWNEFLKARDEYFNQTTPFSTREWIESKTGVPMAPPAKRNGNTQRDHLQADILVNKASGRRAINTCKVNRELVLEDMRENGEITGRPVGSGTKQQLVQQWRSEHPDGIKADCIRDTGLTKPTVYKWWD